MAFALNSNKNSTYFFPPLYIIYKKYNKIIKMSRPKFQDKTLEILRQSIRKNLPKY